MKKYISYTMMALLGTVALSTAASTEDTMMEKEKAAWQAFKDRKPDDFEKVVSAKLVGVYAQGTSDLQKELADMQKWDMKSFAISDYKVTSDGSDTVVTTYKVTIEGTYDGKDQSGTYNAASVWKKQKAKGEWQAIFHTNVKQAPAGG
jgi:ketosteroid isomerase-like protein